MMIPDYPSNKPGIGGRYPVMPVKVELGQSTYIDFKFIILRYDRCQTVIQTMDTLDDNGLILLYLEIFTPALPGPLLEIKDRNLNPLSLE